MKNGKYVVLCLTLGLLFFVSGIVSAQTNQVSRKSAEQKVEKPAKATKKTGETIELKAKTAKKGDEKVKMKTERKKNTGAANASGQPKKMVKNKKFNGKVYRKSASKGKSKEAQKAKQSAKSAKGEAKTQAKSAKTQAKSRKDGK